MVIKSKNLGATDWVAPFFYYMSEKNKNNEELRPSKMRGVAFPKAKYGVILAVIIIIIVNLVYYKESIFSFLKLTFEIVISAIAFKFS